MQDGSLRVFFVSLYCSWHEADVANGGSSIFQQHTFVGVLLFMRSAHPFPSFTMDETKEELLFASKSAYFEISVRIQEIKRKKNTKYCKSLHISRSLLLFLFRSTLRHSSATKNGKMVFLLLRCVGGSQLHLEISLYM